MGNASKKGADKRATIEAYLAQARERLGKAGGDLLLHQRYHSGRGKLEKDYLLTKKALGFGVNGHVHLATSKKNGRRCAVKTFHLNKCKPAVLMSAAQEMEIMLMVDHPHIVRLIDIYETGSELHLVMECMEGGELFDRLVERKRFGEDDAVETIQQMLGVVTYLHSRNIVHRDLKPENFLYEVAGGSHLKVTDFGFSRYWDSIVPMKDHTGTLSYTAPEVLAKSHTSQCDVWSIGVIAFMLVSGYSPFTGSTSQLMQDVSLGKYEWRESNWNSVSSDAIDFVNSLLTVDPVQRPTASSALNHPWLTQRTKPLVPSIPHSVQLSMVKGILQYQEGSRFRRACLTTMARSMALEDFGDVRSYFMSFDTLQNGSFCVKRLRESVAASKYLSEEEQDALFQEIDADQTMSYSEFLGAMVPTLIQPRQALLMDAFRRFDVNSRFTFKPESGSILETDLQKVFSVDNMEARKLLFEVNYNQIDRVSFEDFSRIANAEALPSKTSERRDFQFPSNRSSSEKAIFEEETTKQRCSDKLFEKLCKPFQRSFDSSSMATNHNFNANLLGGCPIGSHRFTM